MHKAKRQKEQLLVVLRETKHRSLELCISGRANLAKAVAGILRRSSIGKCKFVKYFLSMNQPIAHYFQRHCS